MVINFVQNVDEDTDEIDELPYNRLYPVAQQAKKQAKKEEEEDRNQNIRKTHCKCSHSGC